MDEKELRQLLRELREAGWGPMVCDTPIDVYDNPVNCGTPEDVGDIDRRQEWYPAELIPPGGVFRVPARGDSMRDAGIVAGDMLTIEAGTEPQSKDVVLVCIDGDFTVKAYYEDDAGDRWLVPFNDRYEPIRLTGDRSVRLVGRVVEVSKRNPRVRHRDASRIVHSASQQGSSPRELSREDKRAVVCSVAHMIQQGRQWFSVYRALVELRQHPKGDYAGFCLLVCESMHGHAHLPSARELERMDVFSFRKPVALWDETDAPVRGNRFQNYKRIAEQTLQKLSKTLQLSA